jgi:hypothetical protein
MTASNTRPPSSVVAVRITASSVCAHPRADGHRARTPSWRTGGFELPEPGWRNLPHIDHGSPELANQTQRDLLIGRLAKQDPAITTHWQLRGHAQGQSVWR